MDPPPNTVSNSQGRLRVAVVDDHSIIRSIFKTVVEDDPGLDLIWSAASLAEARCNLAQIVPDLLILDIHLPDGNGYNFASETVGLLPQMRVLIVSSHQGNSAAKRALECGAKGYLPKSSSPQELFEAIDVVRRGETYFR